MDCSNGYLIQSYATVWLEIFAYFVLYATEIKKKKVRSILDNVEIKKTMESAHCRTK